MSTYSTSLQIQLIANGDQSGIWGTTTNTNWNLVEQAITGVQAITMLNADYTLTVVNGASDEARNAVLVVTGTNSDVRKIVAPLVPKTYLVCNNTTGGYSITIGGSTGSVATVLNGSKQLVYCDGTSFYSASVPYNGYTGTGSVVLAASPTISSPTLTGTPVAPTASAGTNTTQIATTAFVTAAVTAVLSAIYPVGSIYTNSSVSTNPGTLLGFGTWTAFGAGRVMVGLDAGNPLFDTAEETGGSADAIAVSHTHSFSATTSSAGDHQHNEYHYSTNGTGDGAGPGGACCGGSIIYSGINTGNAGTHTHTVSGTTGSTGSSGTNANYQPYITVYMWKRTA